MEIQHLLFILLDVLLLHKFTFGFSLNHVVELKYNGSTEDSVGETGVIQSLNFPDGYAIDNTVYVYYISTQDKSCYVQLVFTDFNMNPVSSVKIYDGWNSSAATYVFPYVRGDSSMPIFQSKSQYLTVVFKTGINPKQRTHYGGFRAMYSFVSYSREYWVLNSMPSTGVCPYISSSQGQLYVTGASVVYNYHCVWTLQRTFSWRTFGIRVISVLFTRGDLELEIHNGLTSQSALALRIKLNSSGKLTNQRGSDPEFPVHLNSDNFYVSLRGSLTSDDHIHLAFSDIYSSWTSNSSINRLPMFSSSNVCPFKNSKTHTSQCLMYWESEKEDGSCDVYQSKCRTSNKCYHHQRDRCDGFNDCGDLTDETSCRFGIGRWNVWRELFLMLGAAAILFILRDMLKNRRRVARDCSDCECSRSCLKDMWCNLWKDSVFTHYIKKCPLCKTCTESNTREDQAEAGSRVTQQASASAVVAVIPITATTVVRSGRRRNHRTITYACPINLAAMPPAYSEHEVPPTGTQIDNIPPPTYEETIATSTTEDPPVLDLPSEPPPAYEPMEQSTYDSHSTTNR